MACVAWGLVALIAWFSIEPVTNLFSAQQIMNTSFNPWELVNTYGAFGSIGRERYNIVFEGTDAASNDASALWRPYPYRGLPGDIHQRPPQVAPYQLRLDWQMWFAAMSTPQRYPWTLRLVWKLLHNDPATLGLFAANPFPTRPPHYVRALLYRYRFAPPHNPRGDWWTRTLIGIWLPPFSADDPELHLDLEHMGWSLD